MRFIQVNIIYPTFTSTTAGTTYENEEVMIPEVNIVEIRPNYISYTYNGRVIERNLPEGEFDRIKTILLEKPTPLIKESENPTAFPFMSFGGEIVPNTMRHLTKEENKEYQQNLEELSKPTGLTIKDIYDDVKCPNCGSRARVQGFSSTTAVYCPPVYDSEGRISSKNGNITTTSWTCSNCGIQYTTKG